MGETDAVLRTNAGQVQPVNPCQGGAAGFPWTVQMVDADVEVVVIIIEHHMVGMVGGSHTRVPQLESRLSIE